MSKHDPTPEVKHNYAVLVRDKFGAPLKNAKVFWNEPNAQLTDSFGAAYYEFAEVDVTNTYLRIQHPDYQDFQSQRFTCAYRAQNVVVGGYVSPYDIDLGKLTPKITLQRLVPRGRYFQLEDGTYWTGIGCTDFNLYNRYLNGEDVNSILAQRSTLGFNYLRIFTFFDIGQYGIGVCLPQQHPDFYWRIPNFLDLCASYGLYVEFVAYTGPYTFWPGGIDETHWTKLGDACKGKVNVLLELVNENDQTNNHIDTSKFAPLFGILCSHGSNGGQQKPVTPFWDYCTYHNNAEGNSQEITDSQWWRKSGHNAMEVGESVPTLCDEDTRCPNYDSNSDRYEDSSKGGLLIAGRLFHSVSGKCSQLFDTTEIICAQAFVKGAQAYDLKYQDGQYHHDQQDIDYENAHNLLRYYRKVLPDSSYQGIEIRKLGA